MMYLIMTAGIMGLCLFLVSRLSRACGLHLKGRALALAGVFATSIALLLPVFAPFLTRGYYWKLGGLVFLAAALVTAYNAHLLKRDAARDGETAHAAKPPTDAAAEAEDIPAPAPAEAPQDAPQASAPEAAGPQEAPPETAEPQGAPQAAPPEDAPTPAPAAAPSVPALQETAEMTTPKPEAEPETASGTEAQLLPPEQKPVLVPASKGARASAPTPAAPAAVPEAADAAPDASAAPDMPAPVAASARALPTEARTAPEPAHSADTPPVADAPAKEPPAAAGTAFAPPPAKAAPPRHTIFSRRPADAAFADELAALSSLDAFLDYAYAAQQRREFPRALAAYREALRQYTDDPYVPYLFIDLGNLCKQQARYEDCIEVYREGLRLPIIAGNEAMAEEFRKNLLYLCLVYNILKKHQALATPFSEIPQTYRAEIETAYQAKLAMHPGS